MRERFLAGILLVVFGISVSAPVFASRGSQGSPKLLNLFLDYLITDENARELSKWDIVVVDMDQQYQFPEQLRLIKRLNPNTKILAYVNVSEVSDARMRAAVGSPSYALAHGLPESWFMHHPDGTHASIWPTNNLMNATTQCPEVQGRTWSTYVGPFVRDSLMSSGFWDGVFLDAAYGDLTQSFGANLDMNNDGLADDAASVDNAWRAGMQSLIKNVRASLGPDALIMNNSSASYAPLTNGVLFENFPRYGWAWPFQELRKALSLNSSPKISAVNTNTGNQEQPWDYKLMRYGLTSALVADGYFSFDAGDWGHHRTWWYDEYDAAIGKPIGPARAVISQGKGATNGVWSREFEHATVYVNSLNEAKTVTLGGEHERLTGAQDPMTNSGAIEIKTTIPLQDGIILMRRSRSTDIRNSAFTNGEFVQVRALNGIKQKQGFFAQTTDATGGATVLRTDLDRDGVPDVIIAEKGEVRWTTSGGTSASVRPFGAKFRGTLSVAAGKIDGKTMSIVIGAGEGLAPTITTYTIAGKQIRLWMAYQPLFRGGVHVTVADLNIDGRAEIITAPGVGGGSHIRFFTETGEPARGGFFAFKDSVSAGAFVASGDVNGDGFPELVVGTGPKAAPSIRVYDRSGRVLQDLVMDATMKSRGVPVIVSDVTADGVADILVPTDFTL